MGLEMICANPDRIVQRGDRIIYCAGALADVFQSLGGTVLMAGKPHAAIYDLSFSRAASHLERPVSRTRVLAIGDGVQTDVAGANNQGLDILFIATGINQARMLGVDRTLDISTIETFLGEYGASARYALASLAW